MDHCKDFNLYLNEEQITSETKARVVEMVLRSKTRFLGSYAGENISLIELPNAGTYADVAHLKEVDLEFESLSLDLALHRAKWPVLAGNGLELKLSKHPEGKLQITDREGLWIVYPIFGFKVGVIFPSVMDCLSNIGNAATAKLISKNMSGLYFDCGAKKIEPVYRLDVA